MTDLRGIFGQPFPEQLAAWRLRLQELRPTQTWTDVEPQFHDQGFMVAGAWKAELLADLAAAVDKAENRGTGLEEFRRDYRKTVAKHGWHGWKGEGSKKGEAWRTRVIYRTNLATTYAAGRRAQLIDGGFAFWVYRHGGSREPRLQHLSWNGIALPPDHPFWASHSPPNGWGCSCYVTGARTAAGVRRVGGDPDKLLPPGWDAPDPKTGLPKGIDKGWAYAPGATVSEAIIATTERLPRLPPALGSALMAATPAAARDELEHAFGRFVDQTLAGLPKGERFILGAMKPAWVEALQSRDVPLVSAEIGIRDRDVWHIQRDSKVQPVQMDWLKRLPALLDSPDAVILERAASGNALLLIFRQGEGANRIVMKLNFRDSKAADVINLIRSGRVIGPEGLGSMRGATFDLLEGSL